MEKRIKVVPQLDQVLMPYSRTFKELKEKQEAGPHHSFCKEKKEKKKERQTRNILKHRFGGGSIIRGFSFFAKREELRGNIN